MRVKFVLATAVVLAVSSCDKAEKLRMEKDKLEAERAALQSEADHYQNQHRMLVSPGVITVQQMEKLAQDTLKQAAEAEAAGSAKMAKWQAIEAELKPVKERVDAWKAKYLK